MTGGDGRLQCVGAKRLPERDRAIQCVEPACDQHAVPSRAVLIEQENGLTGWADAAAETRRLYLQEGDEPVHLRVVGRDAGEDATEPEGLVAQLVSNEAIAFGRLIAFVADRS